MMSDRQKLLREITKGVKLRPTTTNDKSLPYFTIEDCPKLNPLPIVGGSSPQLSLSSDSGHHSSATSAEISPRATLIDAAEVILVKTDKLRNHITPVPSLPPTDFSRERLLAEIRNGTQLRRTATNDRSSPFIDRGALPLPHVDPTTDPPPLNSPSTTNSSAKSDEAHYGSSLLAFSLSREGSILTTNTDYSDLSQKTSYRSRFDSGGDTVAVSEGGSISDNDSHFENPNSSIDDDTEIYAESLSDGSSLLASSTSSCSTRALLPPPPPPPPPLQSQPLPTRDDQSRDDSSSLPPITVHCEPTSTSIAKPILANKKQNYATNNTTKYLVPNNVPLTPSKGSGFSKKNPPKANAREKMMNEIRKGISLKPTPSNIYCKPQLAQTTLREPIFVPQSDSVQTGLLVEVKQTITDAPTDGHVMESIYQVSDKKTDQSSANELVAIDVLQSSHDIPIHSTHYMEVWNMGTGSEIDPDFQNPQKGMISAKSLGLKTTIVSPKAAADEESSSSDEEEEEVPNQMKKDHLSEIQALKGSNYFQSTLESIKAQQQACNNQSQQSAGRQTANHYSGHRLQPEKLANFTNDRKTDERERESVERFEFRKIFDEPSSPKVENVKKLFQSQTSHTSESSKVSTNYESPKDVNNGSGVNISEAKLKFINEKPKLDQVDLQKSESKLSLKIEFDHPSVSSAKALLFETPKSPVRPTIESPLLSPEVYGGKVSGTKELFKKFEATAKEKNNPSNIYMPSFLAEGSANGHKISETKHLFENFESTRAVSTSNSSLSTDSGIISDIAVVGHKVSETKRLFREFSSDGNSPVYSRLTQPGVHQPLSEVCCGKVSSAKLIFQNAKSESNPVKIRSSHHQDVAAKRPKSFQFNCKPFTPSHGAETKEKSFESTEETLVETEKSRQISTKLQPLVNSSHILQPDLNKHTFPKDASSESVQPAEETVGKPEEDQPRPKRSINDCAGSFNPKKEEVFNLDLKNLRNKFEGSATVANSPKTCTASVIQNSRRSSGSIETEHVEDIIATSEASKPKNRSIGNRCALFESQSAVSNPVMPNLSSRLMKSASKSSFQISKIKNMLLVPKDGDSPPRTEVSEFNDVGEPSPLQMEGVLNAKTLATKFESLNFNHGISGHQANNDPGIATSPNGLPSPRIGKVDSPFFINKKLTNEPKTLITPTLSLPLASGIREPFTDANIALSPTDDSITNESIGQMGVRRSSLGVDIISGGAFSDENAGVNIRSACGEAKGDITYSSSVASTPEPVPIDPAPTESHTMSVIRICRPGNNNNANTGKSACTDSNNNSFEDYHRGAENHCTEKYCLGQSKDINDQKNENEQGHEVEECKIGANFSRHQKFTNGVNCESFEEARDKEGRLRFVRCTKKEFHFNSVSNSDGGENMPLDDLRKFMEISINFSDSDSLLQMVPR